MKRAACVQSWPPFTMEAATAPSAAAGMFASSKTTKGALPPSSRWSFFTFEVAAFMISFPVAVSPVKETMSTLSLDASSFPTTAPGPVIRFTVPAGVQVCLDEVRDLDRGGGAGPRSHARPLALVEGRSGRIDGRPRILQIRLRDGGDRATGRGVDHRVRVFRMRRHPFSVHEVEILGLPHPIHSR